MIIQLIAKKKPRYNNYRICFGNILNLARVIITKYQKKFVKI